MKDLIKALQIFLKYENSYSPTHCEHDELTVNINPDIISKEDIDKLCQLGFEIEDDYFISYRFGSC